MPPSKQKYESQCWDRGINLVAGLDEVGMGCLAGPVVAAAVVISPKTILPKGIDDSKKLSAKRREELDLFIRASVECFAIGIAQVEEIDSINIFQAARLAMKRALDQLSPRPEFLLIDGRAKIDSEIPQLSLIKGDQLSVSIGAASILAKVYRDQLMQKMDETYPGYQFAKHKGYGSVAHRRSLQEKGPSPLHRKSFSWTPV